MAKGKQRSKLEEQFSWQLRARRVPPAEREYYFAKSLKSKTGRPRMWRFDFAWPEIKVAVEIQGGVWSGGRHSRGAGMRSDYEKLNSASILGWRVLYGEPSMVRDNTLVDFLQTLLRGTGWVQPNDSETSTKR